MSTEKALCIFSGQVIPGAGRGRDLGFPTVNLQVKELLELDTGVYAVWVECEGKRMKGAMNYGGRPTFLESELQVEIHLIGENGNFYGKELDIFVMKKVREIKKFIYLEELKIQIQDDVAEIKKILSV